ncbi:hypothetical protein [Pelagibius sp.]|uniref:hypothetical protein n=1 Tax=Pelagibius sp. TaxID=1931238 RepID=UPI003B50B159
MKEANLSSESKSQLVGDALVALTEEHPVVVSNRWSQPFGDLLPLVVEIVVQLPVLANKRDSIEERSGLILEAYVSGCWQMRQEALASGVEAELPHPQAVLEAVRAALAELFEETREELNQELARRMWHGTRRRAATGAPAAPGLDHTAAEIELLAEIAGYWTAPPEDGEQRRGRPADHAADFVAEAALEAYEDLTGREVDTGHRTNRQSGEFVRFLARLFGLLCIDRSAENRARRAVTLAKSPWSSKGLRK